MADEPLVPWPMPVEKATALPDLPHQFTGHDAKCWMCGRKPLDALHVAWEKASLAETSTPAPFARERGA